MSKSRLEAFSDAVIAIIITIMVLELHAPDGSRWADVRPLVPVFLSYVLSFVYLGIYWNNHHHMLQAADRVSGLILWANLHLLFWLSLYPFTTAWMDETDLARTPLVLYGCNLLAAAIAFTLLVRAIFHAEGPDSLLREAMGRDLKGKVSPVLYLAGIASALWVATWLAVVCYAAVGSASRCPPIHAVPNGNSDSQNSRCRLAHRTRPLMRSVACSRWWWLFQ